MRLPHGAGGRAWLLAAAVVAVAAGCRDRTGDALVRGDRMYATDRIEEAVAEYKLAARRAGETGVKLELRLARAELRQGNLGDALEAYRRVLARDSSRAPAVAGVLVAAADSARAREDGERMLRLLEPVLDLGIGWVPPELRLAAAETLWERGQFHDALPLYLSAVGVPDSTDAAAVLLHVARTYEELNGCVQAVPYFRAYLERTSRGRQTAERTSAEWHYGTCLYRVAGQQLDAGSYEAAGETLTRLIRLGVPRTLMDQAHLDRGEARLARGEDEGALRDFEEVLRLNPARSGVLVQLAEERIRQIRYARP